MSTAMLALLRNSLSMDLIGPWARHAQYIEIYFELGTLSHKVLRNCTCGQYMYVPSKRELGTWRELSVFFFLNDRQI